jgi:exodeoxyribonuclease V alpha subunit
VGGGATRRRTSDLFPALDRLVAAGALRPLDLHFGRWMGELAGGASDEVLLGACLASAGVGAGDVCVDLARYAGGVALPEGGVRAPGLAEWRAALRASPVVGRPGDPTPLVLDDRDRLYLARYWWLEQRLAAAVRARATGGAPGVDRGRLREGLARLFPSSPGETDWQAVAAALAVLRRLTVISGGPGTGKTRTVTAVLALLAGQGLPARPRIALAAPTGKAAARLAQSVREVASALPLTEAERGALPREASTLHRLLGAVPGRVGFRHDAGNPLHLDALVVDEASMVDLPLMARLVDALPGEARLVLLGDRDQLASVEAGAVLGDLCGLALPGAYSRDARQALGEVLATPPPDSSGGGSGAGPDLGDSVVLLRRSYRFRAEGGIGSLAARVNAGDADGVLEVLRSGGGGELVFETPGEGERAARLEAVAVPEYRAVLEAPGPEEALARLGQFRVLCAVRDGPWGVGAMNTLVERALVRAGFLEVGERDYPGRPVLVTRNDYGLELFNGDVGVLWPDVAAGGRLRAWFERPGGGLRPVLPARLPPHETAFAMTVHKSQGSELDRVLLVLPDRPSPVLTRELVYTAITRARRHVTVWAVEGVLAGAARERVRRTSGLRDALWPPLAEPAS